MMFHVGDKITGKVHGIYGRYVTGVVTYVDVNDNEAPYMVQNYWVEAEGAKKAED